MNKILLYKHSGEYALEHDERELYRASYDANMACKAAIVSSVNKHYNNNKLDARTAVRVVAEQFGFERMLYVLAVTVRYMEWDMRFSNVNKQWARTISIFEDETAFDREQSVYIVVDGCHSGLLDIFITAARQEHLQSLSCYN